MPALEYVVRPNQTPDAYGKTLIPSTPTSSTQRATITWGAQTTLPTLNSGVNFTVKCCQEQLNEDTRESDNIDIPIQQTADNTGHVTVARPRTVALKRHENNTCGADDPFGQVGAIAPDISAAFDDLQANMDATFNPPNVTNCATTWNFKNQ